MKNFSLRLFGAGDVVNVSGSVAEGNDLSAEMKTFYDKALIELAKMGGATVVGAGVAIEKAYQGGGDEVRKMGYRVESLARISAMNDGKIEFC